MYFPNSQSQKTVSITDLWQNVKLATAVLWITLTKNPHYLAFTFCRFRLRKDRKLSFFIVSSFQEAVATFQHFHPAPCDLIIILIHNLYVKSPSTLRGKTVIVNTRRHRHFSLNYKIDSPNIHEFCVIFSKHL